MNNVINATIFIADGAKAATNAASTAGELTPTSHENDEK